MRKKSFWVMSSSLISSEDTRALALLYQPLIGDAGFGLYMMLINLIDRNNLQTDVQPVQLLLDLMAMNNDSFKDTIHKLEAIGLLTTFLKENIYLFRINMPLKASQFFFDGILGSYLKSEIGDDNFKYLFDYFSVPEISRQGYKNITRSFDEVYTVRPIDLIESDKFIFGRRNGSGVTVKDAFDFDQLFEVLPVRLKKKRLYTKKVLSQIASVMYVYNFTNDEMIDILTRAYDENNNKIFAEKIAIISNDYFTRTYGDNLITIEKKPEDSDDIDLTKIRPQDIITLFGTKMTNQSFALDTIRQFIERNAVDIGLINAVILISLRFNDDLPSLAYLEKVLADWLSRGIKTAEDALPLLRQVESRPAKKKTYGKRQKAGSIGGEEPEWLDDILDSLWEDD